MPKSIYVICPVRGLNTQERAILDAYVARLEFEGRNVHYPPRDVDQSDPIGWSIAQAHLEAMKEADEVHVYWDVTSKGSHLDVGMALALDKKFVLINEPPLTPHKSYTNVLRILAGLDPVP